MECHNKHLSDWYIGLINQ